MKDLFEKDSPEEYVVDVYTHLDDHMSEVSLLLGDVTVYFHDPVWQATPPRQIFKISLTLLIKPNSFITSPELLALVA